jgi:hypothetical protein
MTIHTTFPDAIVFPDGTIRFVTKVAKQWAYTNTNIDRWCTASTVPDYVDFDDTVPEIMENTGFVLKQERVPVSHYRSKRRSWPKPAIPNDTKVIDFLQRIPKQCREDAMCRAYGRHRQRHHRMQEAAEKKKARDD